MIIFRADGNPTIGLGHVMRCLSIADAFRDMGRQCRFLTADGGVSGLIASHGHGVEALGTQFDRMDSEPERFQAAINSSGIRTVFVDSYYATENYLKTLHGFCRNKGIILAYIDDVLAFPYPCDALINYNIYASEADYREMYKGRSVPEFLLGTAYAPLRAEFQNLSDRVVKEDAREILISTGGADSGHMGMELAKTIIGHSEWNGYGFHFIIGSMNGDKDKMESLARGRDNIRLHENAGKMSALMQSCDAAVSAAGSTLYELCLTQTPAVTYILADNQIPGAKGFEGKGVLSNAGDIREVGPGRLAWDALSKAVELAGDYGARCRMAGRMKKVVDGKGAARIAERILQMTGRTAI